MQTEFSNKPSVEAYVPATAPDFVRIAGYATAGDGGDALYKRVASEPSHAGKVRDGAGNWYELAEPNPKPQMFGAIGDGSTNDTSAIAALLDYASAGTDVDLGHKAYKYTALSINKNVTIRNGTLVSAATSGAQITVNPSARLIARSVKFVGGGSHATVDQTHHLLFQTGGASASRGVGMDIEGCEFSGCGFVSLYSKFCDGNRLVGNKFSDFAYAGFMMVSCNSGLAESNRVEGRDAVGIGGDAYGFAITHWSAGYNTDPHAGTPQAANPFSAGWRIIGNTVIAPKIWEGIDFHGGYDNIIAFNKVYGGLTGILIGGSSGDATGYAGYNSIITGNIVTSLNEDGTLSPDTHPIYGIVFQAGGGPPIVPHDRIVVTNNIVHGYGGYTLAGTPNENIPAIYANTGPKNFVFSDNVVTGWAGTAISISQNAGSGVINNNVFSGTRDVQNFSAIIRFVSNSPGRYQVVGNVLSDDGNAPVLGVATSSSSQARITYGSDFRRTASEVGGSFTPPGEVRKISYV